MRKPFVLDANILLRFFTDDLPEQAHRCAELLKRVERGEEVVVLPELVLADVIWALEKFYRQHRSVIQELLLPVLGLRGLRFSSKAKAQLALDIYVEQRIDWPDAWVASEMLIHGWESIYSYDADFDKVKGLKRHQP